MLFSLVQVSFLAKKKSAFMDAKFFISFLVRVSFLDTKFFSTNLSLTDWCTKVV